MATFTLEQSKLIEHLSASFANGIIRFEEVLMELVGDILDYSEFQGFNLTGHNFSFDIYVVEPYFEYVKDFPLLDKTLLEFKIQSKTEAEFKVIKHLGYAIIYVSHENQP